MSIGPTHWKEHFDHKTRTLELVETDEADAHFISSRLSDGRHRLLLDINHDLLARGNILYVAELHQERHVARWNEIDTILRRNSLGNFDKRHLWLRFARGFELYASSTKGHQHFVLPAVQDNALDWATYERLQYLFYMVGMVDHTWNEITKRLKMSLLIKPGISKQTAYEARRVAHVVDQHHAGDRPVLRNAAEG